MLKNEEIQKFTHLLNSDTSNDIDLINGTNKYFGGAWYVPIFNPSITTFDDLFGTRKLEIISNIELRNKIVALYINPCA